jgi:hypothetical protein
MRNKLETLEAQAMQLSPADRTHLLERLIACLDVDPDVEQAWAKEADRREAAWANGSVQDIPANEALSRLRAKLSA